MSATLRYRGDKNNIIELAKNLDAFKKVPEKYTETSEIGGTLSLISRLVIVFLIYKEIQYYQEARLKYEFEPDTHTGKVEMFVDITVAMPCSSLSGVDLMDETQQDVFAYDKLQRQSVWWKMETEQREEFERRQHLNRFLREQYHSVVDILFKDMLTSSEILEPMKNYNNLPIVEEVHDACRLRGIVGLNKVAGVLHLVGGAEPVVDLFGDHIMIGFRRVPTNFTHRINRLSFGIYATEMLQPLEFDETLVPDEATTVQYFLNIVPVEIQNTFSTINTYQYSVTENIRVLDADRNSHGSPGIYFKYDWSALKIIVRTDRDSMVHFIIRLSSIIAGIIVISGILNFLLVSLKKIMMGKFAPQLLQERLRESPENTPLAKHHHQHRTGAITTNPALVVTNDLISNANKMSAQVKALIPLPNE